MADIGEPLKRVRTIPLVEPATPGQEPQHIPEKPQTPVREPEKVPG